MIDFSQAPRFKPFQFQIVTLVPEWARAFEVEPAAIERQIPIAHVWMVSNPKKAPKKDMIRFLNNWMRIAKKMGSLVKAPPPLYQEKPPDDEVMTADDFKRMREEITRSRLKNNRAQESY